MVRYHIVTHITLTLHIVTLVLPYSIVGSHYFNLFTLNCYEV